MDFQVPAVQERRGIPKIFLVMFGCVGIVACCCFACVGMTFAAMSMGEATVAMWPFVAITDNPTDLGVVCEGSPAETFSLGLKEIYGDSLSINVTNPVKVNGEDKTYEAEVTIDNETQTLWFVLGDDKGFMGLVGNCIYDIRPAPSLLPSNFGTVPSPTPDGTDG